LRRRFRKKARLAEMRGSARTRRTPRHFMEAELFPTRPRGRELSAADFVRGVAARRRPPSAASNWIIVHTISTHTPSLDM
jgi:hypothetical protein